MHNWSSLVLAALLLASPLAAQQTGETKLQEARQALTGTQKDTAKARELLLDIIDKDQASLPPGSLCYVYVYLGYIEDREKHREEAIAWYKKALNVRDSDPVVECARVGLDQPMTWIRHLDENKPSRTQPGVSRAPVNIDKGYVTTGDPPQGLARATILTAKERRDNFDFLWDAVDKTYACFELKSIDWPAVRQRYDKQLDKVETAEEFYRLLFRLINELKDTHSWLQEYRPVLGKGPELALDLFEGRPFVTAVETNSEAARAGVRPGAEILAVDGLTFAARLEQLRLSLPACSSERAFQRAACQALLLGENGSTATVQLRSPDGRPATVTLKRNANPTRRAALAAPCELTRQRSVHFGRLPSGFGYIWIESFNGREEIADEFDRALEKLRGAPGLILDVRDNQGGFGTAHARIVGRFLKERTLVCVSYIKNGPGHQDLRRHETWFEPSGPWQYAGPVALLINDVTGSASDLFVCCLRSTGRVVTIGSTTHGNLSGVAAYAVLPCGLVIRVSNGYITDAKGKPIEGNGTEPEVPVVPTISDFLKHRDPVLEKAVAILKERRG